jgi:hypothetical protein
MMPQGLSAETLEKSGTAPAAYISITIAHHENEKQSLARRAPYSLSTISKRKTARRICQLAG